jgi:hypothetical protein
LDSVRRHLGLAAHKEPSIDHRRLAERHGDGHILSVKVSTFEQLRHGQGAYRCESAQRQPSSHKGRC